MMNMKKTAGLFLVVFGVLCLVAVLAAQDKPYDPLLNLERIYNSREFASQRFGPARWIKDGSSYTTLEESEGRQGRPRHRASIRPRRGSAMSSFPRPSSFRRRLNPSR